jgi:hypothetical protein
LVAAGGRIELRTVASLSDLTAEAPLIVNCAGLGAAELAGDDSLTPVRGQHVIVDNPGLEEFFVEARSWRPASPSPGVMAGPTIAEATADVVCAGASRARTSMRCPRSARHTAALNPITPAPITTTSGCAFGVIGSSSHRCPAHEPTSARPPRRPPACPTARCAITSAIGRGWSRRSSTISPSARAYRSMAAP